MTTEICNFDLLPHKFFSKIFNDEIIVYELDGVLYAISSFCPHFGGPLEVHNDRINCYWHNWDFDKKNLSCINQNVNIRLYSYSITRISANQALIQDDNKF